MQEIGSGANYRIAVDSGENRVYFWFFGEIMNTSGVAGVMEATKKACDLLGRGFTGLADFTGVKLFGLPDVAQKVQITVLEAGVSKIASVWSGDTFAKLTVDSSAHKVGGGAYDQRRKVFNDKAEAEAWLNG